MSSSQAAISATEIALRHERSTVFENVTTSVSTGDLLVVQGVHRSGKTSLLLALAGRLKLASGALRVLGTSPSTARRRIGLAEQPTVNPLDEALTVRQHFAQAIVLHGSALRPFVGSARTDAVISRIADTLGSPLPPASLIGDLTPVQRFACGVGLALVGEPSILVVDDIDSLREAADRTRAWRLLDALPAALTIVASCQDDAELPTDLGRDVVRLSLSAKPALADA